MKNGLSRFVTRGEHEISLDAVFEVIRTLTVCQKTSIYRVEIKKIGESY